MGCDSFRALRLCLLKSGAISWQICSENTKNSWVDQMAGQCKPHYLWDFRFPTWNSISQNYSTQSLLMGPWHFEPLCLFPSFHFCRFFSPVWTLSRFRLHFVQLLLLNYSYHSLLFFVTTVIISHCSGHIRTMRCQKMCKRTTLATNATPCESAANSKKESMKAFWLSFFLLLYMVSFYFIKKKIFFYWWFPAFFT